MCRYAGSPTSGSTRNSSQNHAPEQTTEVSSPPPPSPEDSGTGQRLTTRLLLAFAAATILGGGTVTGAFLLSSLWLSGGVLLTGGLLAGGGAWHIARSIGEAADRLHRAAVAYRTDPSEAAPPLPSHGVLGEVGTHLQRLADATEQHTTRMEALTQLMTRTSLETEIDAAFETFLADVRETTQAQYAALSIFDDDGEVANFFTLGMTEAQEERIDHLPEGKGLLGHIHEAQETLHLDEMSQHPQSAGFPEGHPEMHSLLAAPITYQGQPLGNLYLSEKRDVTSFSDSDRRFVESAAEAASVLINEKRARLKNENMRATLHRETSAIADVLDRIADGDLSVDIPEGSDDEDIARVWDRLSETTDSLRQILGQVTSASQEIVTASDQISSTADEMSAGVEEQSAQTEEVASAMEQMSRTILENAETVETTSQRAERAQQKARENGQVIYEAIEKMEQIGDVVEASAQTVGQLDAASEEIGDVVATIDEIADQTNLLALNAAIEAARAGNDGQGFAVVAEEVRNLAERTTEATERIESMIADVQSGVRAAVTSMSEGQEEVQEGISLADQAGNALDDMIEDIERVATDIENIAAATQEQSTTSEQVSRSINEISTVTSQNAQGVTEIAASTDDLNALSERLVGTVEQFTLEAESASAPTSVLNSPSPEHPEAKSARPQLT